MTKYLERLDKPLDVPFNDIIKINSVRVTSDLIVMQDCKMEVELVVESNFPKEVLCTYVAISLEREDKQKSNVRYQSGKLLTKKDLKWQDPFLQRLKIKRTLDYKQDKQLALSGIASKFTQLQRKDSAPAQSKTDFNTSLEVEKLVSHH